VNEQLGKKYLGLEEIVKLGSKGRKLCGTLIREASGVRGKTDKITQSSADISCIDEKIEELGFTNPELRPLTDMFSKRKENLVGNNVCLLAIESRKGYIDLMDECEKLNKILKSCLIRLAGPSYISHDSINVAVPGR
jgi:hypothetical protein